MKLVRRIIVILFTLSLFFIITDMYYERELSDAYNIFELDNEQQNLVFSISNSVKNVDIEKYCQYLETIAHETDVVLISQNIETNNGYDFSFYYYSREPLHQIINLSLSNPNESTVYSNYLKNGNLLTILNRDIHLSFLPFSFLKADENQRFYPITAYSYDRENLKEFEQKFRDQYASLIDSVDEMNSDQFNYDRNFRTQVTLFFIMGIVLLMILSLFQISDKLNEISILKMHGFGFIKIGFSLFMKLMVEVLLIEFLISTLLIVLTVRPLNNQSLLLARDYLYALILVNSSLAGVLVLELAVVKNISLPRLLKGLNYNKSLLTLAFCAKIVMLLFLIPMLEPYFSSLYANTNYYIQVNKEEKNFDNIYHVENLAIKDRFDGYNPMNYLYGDTDEKYEEREDIYNFFNNQDALIYQAPVSEGFEDHLINDHVIFYEGFKINKEYIKHSNLSDINGDALHLDLKGETVYVLVPESMYSAEKITKDLFSIEERNPVKLVLIEDQKYLDYGMPFNSSIPLPEFQRTPFFILYSDQAYRYDKSILASSYLLGFDSLQEVKGKLSELSPEKEYELLESNKELKQLKKESKTLFKNTVLQILPGLGVFVIISLSVLVLYYRANREKLSIYKFMGYSEIAANFDLFVEEMLTLLVPTIILIKEYGTNILPTVGILVVLDLFCWIWARTEGENNLKKYINQN